ncbi:3-hydroxyisobutyrate dehydrogenase [Virgibacillus natechei]|uniref:3-hydroxyisobutyrate dehydrogenase n=1 Tax=Virgibacillus natechei TaxID=1216297 RepID=A0ABS4IF17_9BACI|nr:NAD(P)-dependent oxidoreductase [Virgibacillus natechei]MBP1968619.1 3-hydroxyisobutyrate dehydrogenase [Virgibacillus natechei]UZD13726.1 NAD(P)-dependent oxidoreductase [Virgibacillus natechei]
MLSINAKIGFIGTGVMGKNMIANLQKAGYPISLYTRTKEKAQGLLDNGAIWKSSIAELAKSTDVIITMVGYPADVEEVYFGQNGILENAKAGSYVVDMTTSKPSLAIEIYKQALEKNIYSMDAPVSGGDVGAINGSLAIMAGGDQHTFDSVLPLFDIVGENIIRQGGAGAGQHTKLANQITIASNMIGVCEAIAYSKRSGLDPMRVLDSITTGAAGSFSLSKLAPRMLEGDNAPGFYVKHFIKDMTIALESAEEMGLSTPGLSLSLDLYKELAEKGENDSGTQALIKLFE